MIIEQLRESSINSILLHQYVTKNYTQIYDFFNHKNYSELLILKNILNQYIQLNRNTILKLDLTAKENLAFISLLLDISEQLSLIAPFNFLYLHLHSNNYIISKRLKAAYLYLCNISTAIDYTNRYKEICYYLHLASVAEEDNDIKILMTLVHYYAKAVSNFREFNIQTVKYIKLQIEYDIEKNTYHFLRNELLQQVLSIELYSDKDPYLEIQKTFEFFLSKTTIKPKYKKGFLIEENTKYCRELAAVDDNFKSIREISVKYYKTIDSDSVFISLKRGVAILSHEEQLFSYMSSYGNMHYEKLIEAFKKIPQDLFKKAVNITDWGCGQAIASIAYLDFLNMKKIKQTIGRFCLIEPSEINIKRATLHIKKLNANTNIHTINKDIDTLSNQDFRKDQNYTHIHLFSNILDIDNFSMINLLNLIENNFFGSNYFICTSPYINYTKTMRVDGFVKHFSEKINFNMIESLDSQNGEWKNNWTRVIRIFHVTL